MGSTPMNLNISRPDEFSLLNQTLNVECRDVNDQNASFRCEWTQLTPSCLANDGYMDYIYFIYCSFGAHGTVGAVCVIVIWLLVLFLALGVTADDFLCPSLVVISKTLRLSQNIAGVTFLAFGNGAPDIFSSLAGIEQSRSDLVIGELFGAGIFVTTVVAGSISLTKPFKIMERPFLRDIIFYIFATYWGFYLFYSRQIQLKYAAGFIALYGVYILVVILSRLIFQRNKTSSEGSTVSTCDSMETASNTSSSNVFSSDSGESSSVPGVAPIDSISRAVSTSSITIPRHPINITITAPTTEARSLDETILPSNKHLFSRQKSEDNPEAEGVVLRRFSFRNSLAMPRRRTLSNHKKEPSNPSIAAHLPSIVLNNETNVSQSPIQAASASKERPPFIQQWSTTSMMSLISKGPNDRVTPWKDFAFELCPIDVSTWQQSPWYTKILDILKAPVYFLLSLTTPVVDYSADLHNWCKYLAVLQCITGPLFLCFCSKKFSVLLGGVAPVWSIVLAVSAIIAIIVFFTSIVDEPPIYHAVFAYLGFGVSVMWIYALAHEVVSLLKAIGIVFDMSDTILGLTVLAWGNSIGDFISNTSVAKQGFPRMGISACFGGPLLNLLLGIGIPYTVTLVKTGSPIELDYSVLVTVLYSGLAISLVCTLVTMTILRFEVKRWYGIFLIVFYFCFLAVAIMVETKVI